MMRADWLNEIRARLEKAEWVNYATYLDDPKYGPSTLFTDATPDFQRLLDAVEVMREAIYEINIVEDCHESPLNGCQSCAAKAALDKIGKL